jgi:hypothetical protein
MKKIILITSFALLAGGRSAFAGACTSYEIKDGCHTELGAPIPSMPHGRPVCVCSPDESDIDQAPIEDSTGAHDLLPAQIQSEVICNPPSHLDCAYYDHCRCERGGGLGGGMRR